MRSPESPNLRRPSPHQERIFQKWKPHLKKDRCFLVSMGATTSIPNLFTPTTSPLPIGTFTSAGIPVGPFIKDTIYCILAVLPNTTNPTPICEAQESLRSVSRIPPQSQKPDVTHKLFRIPIPTKGSETIKQSLPLNFLPKKMMEKATSVDLLIGFLCCDWAIFLNEKKPNPSLRQCMVLIKGPLQGSPPHSFILSEARSTIC